MNVIVVVAAVRIQQWIVRTPELFLIRGASEALSTVTRHTEVANALKGTSLGDLVYRDASDVDGVVVLESQDPAQAKLAAEWLLTHLSRQLPAVEWKGWAHEADTYVEAFAQVNGAGAVPSVGSWHRLPMPLEIPLAAVCEGCGQESATETISRPGRVVRVGPDCAVRFRHNRWDSKREVARDFTELARTGGVSGAFVPAAAGRRDAANHVATIAADGNRVGDLFTEVSKAPATVHKAVSDALNRANAAAIAAAAHVAPDAEIGPAITHFAGGDDIVVSVAARFAWAYAAALATEFETVFQTEMSRVLDEASCPDPAVRKELLRRARKVSIGVGIVFAHAKHPFSHCHAMAEKVMKNAKRAAKGGYATASWVDLTVEQDAPRGRSVAIASLNEDLAGRDHPVLLMNSSGRNILASMINAGRNSGVSPAEVGNQITRWAYRTDRVEILSHRVGGPKTPWTQQDLDHLDNLVDRARWWPVPNPTEAVA